jgi:hypothetical protein
MQLCRLAGHEAVSVGANRIKWGHVDQILDRYGRNRLDDLSREYRNQCHAIGSVLNAFATHESVYKTRDLLAAIERDILEHVEVSVDGRSRVGAIEIARFLFRIGFLLARDVREGGSVKYFHFEERDRLLENRANLDDGMDWYIHPAFHRVLSLRQTAP